MSNIKGHTVEEVHRAIQELAYSYYMRGKNIQYNTMKSHFFSPEEATYQNVNYLTCSRLARNIYHELFNITLPTPTEHLLAYSRENIGNPEVIAYSHINSDKNVEMKIYSPEEPNKYKILINPSIKDIIPLVNVGDVLCYTGHTILIYKIEKDENGYVKEAIIIESGHGKGKSYVNSKIANKVKLPNGSEFAGPNHFLYLNEKNNSKFKEGLIQGSIGLKKFSTYKHWVNLNNTQQRKDEYTILRFIHKDSNGNAILKFNATDLVNSNQILNDEIIILSQNQLDRVRKFNHLYIEKTVDAYNNNIVELNDILNYKIIIKNLGKQDYLYDLIVTENLSEYVTYIAQQENKTIISFNKDLNNKKLAWNIGKLKSNEEFIINYTVKVTSGKPRDIIESTGFVGNIKSAKIRNTIGVNLDKIQTELIETKYKKLKGKYNGKKLINEIYKKALNYDMEFDKFDITSLIINTKLTSTKYQTIYLNKDHPFYNAVLNNYWSTLCAKNYSFIKDEKEVTIYDLKGFRDYNDAERRRHHIYPQTFKTGDILIYLNHNDAIYTVKDNKLETNYITYENGEYAYIYIQDKGFVGVNLGDDGIADTKEDRNKFNSKYYKDNNLELYPLSKKPKKEELENANIQSLFGKDYYVILRPSLAFNFK